MQRPSEQMDDGGRAACARSMTKKRRNATARVKAPRVKDARDPGAQVGPSILGPGSAVDGAVELEQPEMARRLFSFPSLR